MRWRWLICFTVLGPLPALGQQAEAPGGRASGVGAEAAPSAVVWHDGDRERTFWLSTSEVWVHPETDAVRTREQMERLARAAVPDGTVLEANPTMARMRLPSGSSLRDVRDRAARLSKPSGVRAVVGIFYPSQAAKGLPYMHFQEMVVHFREPRTAEAAAQWGDSYGVSLLRDLGLDNAFLFSCDAADLCLEQANAAYRDPVVRYAYPNWVRSRQRRDDPLSDKQWHLDNLGTCGVAKNDADVAAAWFDGWRGTHNEVIAIVDDGLEVAHEDLTANVLPGISWDWVDGDADPTGGDHGTSVAGVAAARGGNGIGVSGVAPEAGLVGYRLGNSRRDSEEAAALLRSNQLVDIYSNSWGPADLQGLYRDGPSPLTEAALQTGVTSGRGGRGNIYVFAGGNGGLLDNSNYDGYANSRYTIAVAASTDSGDRAFYSEPGANLLVNAPSSGGACGITTTDRSGAAGYDVTGNYYDRFGGTSAAAPVVSGVAALMLQANPDLGWRDVPYIQALTAQKNDPFDPGWTLNGAGYHVSHDHGFGRVDAEAAVNLAARWTPFGRERSTSATASPNVAIPDNDPTGVSSSVAIVDDFYVEFAEVAFSAANHPYWGDLEIVLTSPPGTQSVLAQTHQVDPAYRYDGWRFGVARVLGERSSGIWSVTVRDQAVLDTGTFQSWTLKLYGHQVDPDLGLGVLLSQGGQYLATRAYFGGGLSVNGSDVSLPLSVNQSDALVISGSVNVDPMHVGQIADLVLVAGYTGAGSGNREIFYMRRGSRWEPWDGQASSLAPAVSGIRLEILERPLVFKGRLSGLPGAFRIFVGYRLQNGDIVFNGARAMRFAVV